MNKLAHIKLTFKSIKNKFYFRPSETRLRFMENFEIDLTFFRKTNQT